jgi:hypothetical protein
LRYGNAGCEASIPQRNSGAEGNRFLVFKFRSGICRIHGDGSVDWT